MSTTLKTLALPALLSLAAGCLDGTDQAAAPAADVFLFDLTAEQVLAVKPVARTEMSDAAWLDAHRGEFNCTRYGTLCRDLGDDAAYQVIELGYQLALDGADRDAINAAQSDAIADAMAALPVIAEANVRATSTAFFYGGSTSHRLKIVVRAQEMWPSLELRASGDCITQRNAFGWLPAASDRINGTMTATFANLPVMVDARTIFNGNTLTFAAFQRDANSLTVQISCTAIEEGWNASGSVTQDI